MKNNNKFCCEAMARYIANESVAIEYECEFREYSIDEKNDVGTCIRINYCPWCGIKLPESLRHEYVKELNLLGYELLDDDIPEKYKTDAWWRGKTEN